MKRRIEIKEYQNCINIEIKTKKAPLKKTVFIILTFLCASVFFTAKKYGMLLPWALVLSGFIYYVLWLFLEKTTLSIFPHYIMTVKNYFFLDITGRFFQRDAMSGVRKNPDNTGIVFECLNRPQILVSGLNPEETSFVMKFLVFSLGKAEFKKSKKET